jgi:tetratricopeptide (TPR) repeat protein
MIFKKLMLFCACCWLSIAAVAQNSRTADSLEKLISVSTDLKEKFNLLLNASGTLVYSDVSKSLEYGKQAYKIADELSYKEGKLNACLQLASVYYFLSDLSMAMDKAQEAKSLANNLGNDLELARSYDAIGTIYYDIGNQAKSSEYFFLSLKIYEKLKNKDGIGGTFCRIGTLYFDQKDYIKAVEYYSNSIRLARELKNDMGIASNLNNLAKVYSEKKEYAKALQTYEEALQINLKNNETYLVASNYLNIADVYLKMNEYAAAITKLNQARKIFEKLGNKLRQARSQALLSEIYLKTGQLSQAEELALSALRIGQKLGYKEIIVSSSAALSKLYLKKNDSVAAFRYYILEKQYQDSLFRDEKQKTLASLEFQYRFEKNEQNVQLARQRRNVAIIVISGCLLFSIVIIILISKQLRLKAKKLELEKASHERELDFKNKEMVLNVMSLMKKNEMLADLSQKLIHIEEESTSAESKITIKKVAHELQKSQEDEIWKEFSHRFKEVHGDFYNTLLQKFPTLSPNELKLCAFLRLNMSSKDIAELTGQRVASLETARYRLRQKLGIANSEVNLITFLSSI